MYIFQQDGARSHTSRDVKAYVEALLEEMGVAPKAPGPKDEIPALPWPPSWPEGNASTEPYKIQEVTSAWAI